MKRKLLSLVLVLAMVLSLAPAAFAAGFDDTTGHWAEEAINRWSGYGVVQGMGDGSFAPNGDMTRGQAATVFVNLLGLESTEGAIAFNDVAPDAWYADAMAKASAAGIINGTSTTEPVGSPEMTLTRETFFTMFARALGIQPQDTTSGLVSDGADWSRGYINALTDKGYVKGDGTGVNALADINRASVMSLMNQTISTYVNTPNTTVEANGEGVTLVAAGNVTLTGTMADVVVAEGAEGGSVTLRNATVNGAVTVNSDANLTLTGTTTVETVAVSEKAEGASVTVGSSASVETLSVAAPEASLTVSGSVGTVEVADTATGAGVTATTGAKIAEVKTEASGTKVSGSGSVAKVSATGDAASTTQVTTQGTQVSTTNSGGETSNTTTAGTNPASGVQDTQPVIAYNAVISAGAGSTSVLDSTKTYKNVVIADTVGDGTVTIENVTITDDLIIMGGGKDSIYLKNVKLGGRVIMAKATDTGKGTELPRLVLEKTPVTQVVAEKPATIEAVDKNSAVGELVAQEAVTVQGKSTEVATVTVPTTKTTTSVSGIKDGEEGDKGGSPSTVTSTASAGSAATAVTVKGAEVSEIKAEAKTTIAVSDAKIDKVTAQAQTEIKPETVGADVGEIKEVVAQAKVEVKADVATITVPDKAAGSNAAGSNAAEVTVTDGATVGTVDTAASNSSAKVEVDGAKVGDINATAATPISVKNAEVTGTISTSADTKTTITVENATVAKVDATGETEIKAASGAGTSTIGEVSTTKDLTVSSAGSGTAAIGSVTVKDDNDANTTDAVKVTVSAGTINEVTAQAPTEVGNGASGTGKVGNVTAEAAVTVAADTVIQVTIKDSSEDKTDENGNVAKNEDGSNAKKAASVTVTDSSSSNKVDVKVATKDEVTVKTNDAAGIGDVSADSGVTEKKEISVNTNGTVTKKDISEKSKAPTSVELNKTKPANKDAANKTLTLNVGTGATGGVIKAYTDAAKTQKISSNSPFDSDGKATVAESASGITYNATTGLVTITLNTAVTGNVYVTYTAPSVTSSDANTTYTESDPVVSTGFITAVTITNAEITVPTLTVGDTFTEIDLKKFVSGGYGTYTFEQGGTKLPASLTLVDGVISGTVTAATSGDNPVEAKITVKDGLNQTPTSTATEFTVKIKVIKATTPAPSSVTMTNNKTLTVVLPAAPASGDRLAVYTAAPTSTDNGATYQETPESATPAHNAALDTSTATQTIELTNPVGGDDGNVWVAYKQDGKNVSKPTKSSGYKALGPVEDLSPWYVPASVVGTKITPIDLTGIAVGGYLEGSASYTYAITEQTGATWLEIAQKDGKYYLQEPETATKLAAAAATTITIKITDSASVEKTFTLNVGAVTKTTSIKSVGTLSVDAGGGINGAAATTAGGSLSWYVAASEKSDVSLTDWETSKTKADVKTALGVEPVTTKPTLSVLDNNKYVVAVEYNSSKNVVAASIVKVTGVKKVPTAAQIQAQLATGNAEFTVMDGQTLTLSGTDPNKLTAPSESRQLNITVASGGTLDLSNFAAVSNITPKVIIQKDATLVTLPKNGKDTTTIGTADGATLTNDADLTIEQNDTKTAYKFTTNGKVIVNKDIVVGKSEVFEGSKPTIVGKSAGVKITFNGAISGVTQNFYATDLNTGSTPTAKTYTWVAAKTDATKTTNDTGAWVKADLLPTPDATDFIKVANLDDRGADNASEGGTGEHNTDLGVVTITNTEAESDGAYKVTVTANNLVGHTNGAGTPGYWVGVAIPNVGGEGESNTTRYTRYWEGVASSKTDARTNGKSTNQQKVGNVVYDTVYYDVAEGFTNDSKTAVLEAVYAIGNTDMYYTVTYKIDFTNVKLADPSYLIDISGSNKPIVSTTGRATEKKGDIATTFRIVGLSSNELFSGVSLDSNGVVTSHKIAVLPASGTNVDAQLLPDDFAETIKLTTTENGVTMATITPKTNNGNAGLEGTFNFYLYQTSTGFNANNPGNVLFTLVVGPEAD